VAFGTPWFEVASAGIRILDLEPLKWQRKVIRPVA
jgi:hypothetical protein